MFTLYFMAIDLLEDNSTEWVYKITTDYQEGQITINKQTFDRKLTSFEKTSKCVQIKKETVEYEIYYRIAKLMKIKPGIKEYYWLHSSNFSLMPYVNFISVKLLEDTDREWIYEIYTDCEEGMVIIDKETKIGDITSFELTSKQLNVKRETVEFWIYYCILDLMKTDPGIDEFYWINVKLDKD